MQLRHSGIFQQPNNTRDNITVNQEELDIILREYEESLPADLSNAERDHMLQQQRQMLTLNWGLIEQCKDSDFRDRLQTQMSKAIDQAIDSNGADCSGLIQLLSQFSQMTNNAKNKAFALPAHIADFVKQLDLGALKKFDTAIGYGLMAAALLVPAAAQNPETLVAHGGVPAGALSLCDGASHCTQGGIYNTLTGALVSQYNMIIQQVSGSLNLGALWQMTKCMPGLAANIAIQTLQSTPANGSEIIPTCVAKSDTLYGYQASGELTNVGTSTCNAFQNNFPAMTAKCINQGDAYGLNVAIAVMIIAGISLLACAIMGAVFGVRRACRNSL